jgi:hypothetical protein
MAQPGTNQDIVSFSEELGYPDLPTFMSFNSDKVRTTESGAPYVLTGVEYPEYDTIGRTPVEETGTAEMTLAEDFPGPSKQLSMSPSEIVQDADDSVDITETLSTPTGGDAEVQAQLQNFITVNDQAEQEVRQTNLENQVIENAGKPTTEEVKLSAIAKQTPVATEFMYQDGQTLPSGYRQDVAKQKTVTSLNQESMKEVLGLYEEIAKKQSELEAKGFKFDKQEIDATRKAMEEMRESEEAFKVQREARLRAQKEREDKLLNDINTLNEQYRAVEIEPNRIFKNSSTGAKILAALSVGLGAYAASMTGGKNYAMEIIDGAIADDIQAQKLELQQKGAAIDDKRNLLNDLINQGMSESEAEEASRLMLLQKAKRTLDERVLDIKDARMKEEAKNLDKSLKLKIAETQANLMMKAIPQEKLVTETKMMPTAELSMKLAAGREKAKLMAKRSVEKAQGLSQSEKDARTVQGYIGLAPDATDARKMRDAADGTKNMVALLEELIKYRNEVGIAANIGLNREAIEVGKSKANLVAMKLKGPAFLNLGVLAGPDLDLIDEIIPRDPTAIGFVESRYKSIIEYLKMSLDLKAENYGLVPERPEMDVSKMDFRESVKQSEEAALAE